MLSVPLTSGDKTVLAIALGLIVAMYSIYWQSSFYGNQASIFINGDFWSTVDLYHEQTIKAAGKLGESILEVKNGQIRFIESPCPNKLCIHHGWAHQSGEFVACVPNAVSVRVLGPDARFDTINF